jgi:hypothetical protein
VLIAISLPIIWEPLFGSLRISIRVWSEGELKIAERRDAEAAGSEVCEMTTVSD